MSSRYTLSRQEEVKEVAVQEVISIFQLADHALVGGLEGRFVFFAYRMINEGLAGTREISSEGEGCPKRKEKTCAML